jgi:hypothetical protein
VAGGVGGGGGVFFLPRAVEGCSPPPPPPPPRGSFSSPRVRAAPISRTRSGRATSCCSAAKPRACPKRFTRPPTRGSLFRCEKACARSTWRLPPPWRWAKRCAKPQRFRPARADAGRHRSRSKSDWREREGDQKYEAGEGHLTPLGATPHPHRSLALCRVPPPVKVPTQAEADVAHPQHPPRRQGFPKQWQKKASPGIFPGPNNGKKKLG